MSKHIRKHRWILGLIILSLLVFTTVLAQKWVQKTQSNTDEDLNGVWVSAVKNTNDPMLPTLKIYTVGNGGTIIYSENGTDWTAQTSNTPNNLNAVWGSSATNIFAVGDYGTILHSSNEGTTWTTRTSNTSNSLNAIWGSSTTDIFAVGNYGTIVHSINGTDWVVQTSSTAYNINGIWGSSATDVFAVGDYGTILHTSNSGTAWTAQTSGTSYSLNAVWGISSDNVYAVGDHGTVLHYNGTAWSGQSLGASITLNGIWGTSPCSIYAVGESGGAAVIYHYDGSSWTRQDDGSSDYTLNAVHGASIRDIFTVGENGYIVSFDPEDATGPVVCSSQPGIYDVVPVTAKPSATFNAVMDPTTITSETFTLIYYDGQDAHRVSGDISLSDNNSTVTFTPSSNLTEAVTYHATLKAPDAEKGITGVKDSLGVPLGADYSWTFTIWSDPESDDDSGGCFIAVSHPAR